MMQIDAKHMSEASFIRHLLMAGARCGGRKRSAVPARKLPHLLTGWRSPMLRMKAVEGEAEERKK